MANEEDAKPAAKLDYGSVDSGRFFRELKRSSGWKVVTKICIEAAFYVVNKKGDKFVSSSGTESGGKLSIQVHSKANKEDVIVCKWQNYIGVDGLNARIVPELPIQRGSDGEFFFKSVSTTSFGSTRKTIFALKIPSTKDAEEFHMWWLHFNGQTKAWLQVAENKDDMVETFPEFEESDLEKILAIDEAVFDASKFGEGNNKAKRKMSLVSPREVSGVGNKRFRFDKASTPEPSPAKTNEQSEPKEILLDRLVFQLELKARLLLCLKQNNVNVETFDLQIDSQEGGDTCRKFSARISGVPQSVCGYLWSAADAAARSSLVWKVRLEQKRIDDLAEEMTEEALHNEVIAHCKSIPTIRIRPIGMYQDLERLTFQRFCDEPVHPFTPPQRLIHHSYIPMGKGNEVVAKEEVEDDESEVLFDDCEVVLSQQTAWSKGL